MDDLNLHVDYIHIPKNYDIRILSICSEEFDMCLQSTKACMFVYTSL